MEEKNSVSNENQTPLAEFTSPPPENAAKESPSEDRSNDVTCFPSPIEESIYHIENAIDALRKTEVKQLRPYQLDAVADAIRMLYSRPILVGPTGSGKTVMGVEMVRRLQTRMLWVAHRRELIQQAADHLSDTAEEQVGIILSGEPTHPDARFQVASIQTLANREIPHSTGLIVIDECHHATSEQYRMLFESGIPIIGLTATPFRLDGKPLGDMFGAIVKSISTQALCGLGYLIDPIVYASPPPDLSGCSIRGHEFALSDVAKVIQQADLVGDVVQTWLGRAHTLKTLCCAINVEHSKEIVARFQAEEISAEHLDGKTPKVERDAILTRLRSGETTIVSQCQVLTEGWDLPDLQCLIFARPTASLNLHLQCIGRIMRPAENKQFAIVLDHAGNHHRHGRVTRPLEFSLEESQPSTKKNGSSLDHGLRTCENCYAMFDSFTRTCPVCQFFHETQETVIVHDDGELEQFDDTTYEYRSRFWEETEDERVLCGRKPGWALYRFKDRFGEWPSLINTPDGCRELVNPKNTDPLYRREVYKQLLETGRSKGFKDGWVSHGYKKIFGVWPKGFVKDVRIEAGIAQLEIPT